MSAIPIPAKVYFMDFRARTAKENKCTKIGKIFDAAGFPAMFAPGALTAIKVHFGERGNDTYINPLFVRTVVDKIKTAGGAPFITDTNTLYKRSRHNAVDHLTVAMEHGFSYATVSAPLIIADGLRGGCFQSVPIHKKHFQTVKIADAIAQAQNMIVLSHFKGHHLAGFGGAIKNLAMGCAPSQGKHEQHASRFTIDKNACIACGLCMAHCPRNAIFWGKNESGQKKAAIDEPECIGCGECLAACQEGAVEIDYKTEVPLFNERLAEYALGAVIEKKGKVGYISFLMNITPDCDCAPWSDVPLVPDIGIIASTDPVALDKAGYDLVNSQQGFHHSHLQGNHTPGLDKFKGTWNHTTGEVQLKYAEAIGLGTTSYELVTL